MNKLFVLSVVATFTFVPLAVASPGEVQQIDHSNLLNFRSTVLPCVPNEFSITSHVSTYGANSKGLVIVSYKDNQGKERRFAIAVDGVQNYTGAMVTSEEACAWSEKNAYERMHVYNASLNDILRNNLEAVSNSQGLCKATVAVVTVGKNETLQNGEQIESGEISFESVAAKCP